MGSLLHTVLLTLAWSSVTWSSPMRCNQTRGFRSFYKDNSWDHYVFVEEYPAGFCLYHSHQGSSSTCSYSANTSSWTIHGLWPTLQDTKGPCFCNQSATFDLDSIKDLIPKLSVDWTNLLTDTPYDSFWSHEWCKHGTCSDMPDEHTYFSTVLDFFDNMQFGKILQNQGIGPSENTTYSVKDFLNAFKEELGVYPYSVNCMGSHKTGDAILTQIGVCLDESMKVTDCPTPTNTNGCDNSPIYYPTTSHY